MADRDGPQPRVTALAQKLSARIAAGGPLLIDDYMAACLADEEFGYYRRANAIGAAGDFTTAPEIAQIFGELIGLWLADRWQAQGAPKLFNLVELGPGRGVLMQDALRAIGKALPAFLAAARLHLVDISAPMREEQRRRLGAYAPVWHAAFADVPNDAPLFVVANEFFDALPVRQHVRRGAAWHDRRVGLQDGRLAFVEGDPVPADFSADFARAAAPEGAVVETCPAGEALAQALGARIAAHGGAALAIDYGTAVSGWGDTLQALRKHKPIDVFESPGACDLTAHVDFPALMAAARKGGAASYGIVGQGAFLTRLGLPVRLAHLLEKAAPHQARDLAKASQRLLDPREMGTLFKVVCIVPAASAPPPGFVAGLEI
jgi:NADH dehydrogenase [ubiquinone] 1 alpha subcomplex assembly factor 7